MESMCFESGLKKLKEMVANNTPTTECWEFAASVKVSDFGEGDKTLDRMVWSIMNDYNIPLVIGPVHLMIEQIDRILEIASGF